MFRRGTWKNGSAFFVVLALVVVTAKVSPAQSVLVASTGSTAGFPPANHSVDWSYSHSSHKIAAVSAQTLAGRPITLPVPGRLTLIVGSLNGEDGQMAASWWAQASDVCARHAVLDCYQAGGPAQKSAPMEIRDRIAITDRGEPWRAVVKTTTAAHAYAVLLAPDGTTLWQAAGRILEPMPAAGLDAMLADRNY